MYSPEAYSVNVGVYDCLSLKIYINILINLRLLQVYLAAGMPEFGNIEVHDIFQVHFIGIFQAGSTRHFFPEIFVWSKAQVKEYILINFFVEDETGNE